jgi:hypothetical protein
MELHLRSNSGSNGPVAKECHRFLVAGPFKHSAISIQPIQKNGCCASVPDRRPRANKILPGSFTELDWLNAECFYSTTHSLTFLATDSGASTSISTVPPLYARE